MKRSNKSANDIRHTLNEKFFKPAKIKGLNEIKISAGEIDNVNIPNICQAMTGQKIQDEYSVKIISVRDNKNRFGLEAKPSTKFEVTYSLDPNYEPINNNSQNNHKIRTQKIDTNHSISYTLEDKLKAIKILKEYMDEDIITKDEFESKKKEILNNLL